MRFSALICGSGALCALFSVPAAAQSYPAKTIRIVVPIAPGGSTDMVGRLMAQRRPG